RSPMGMIGLVLVALLLVVSIFADFFAPMDPKAANLPFAPPDTIAFTDSTGAFSLIPHVFPVGDSGEFDPITFQPLTGPDMVNPTPTGFFVTGYAYKILWLIPANIHFFGTIDGRPIQLLGTDKFGRDILSRGIVGSRISLMIALAVVTMTTIVGTLVGISSGYLGGRLDAWVQRFVEFVLAFPQLPLYLALTSLIPVTAPSNVFLTFVIGVMAVLGWAQLSREVRSKTLSLARIEYVRAAIAVGSSDARIITRHILPNVLSHVIVAVTLAVPSVVLLESFLGFLGFAVKPPLISWGLMLQDTGTFSVIGSYPWILSPVMFVLITVFAFNALGDGLRDAIDPY
ncbi:MAG TPA: ABC transporter permease, partial [Devosia sp.]|nr:ABC transporter permease [Devosia sp.]